MERLNGPVRDKVESMHGFQKAKKHYTLHAGLDVVQEFGSCCMNLQASGCGTGNKSSAVGKCCGEFAGSKNNIFLYFAFFSVIVVFL